MARGRAGRAGRTWLIAIGWPLASLAAVGCASGASFRLSGNMADLAPGVPSSLVLSAANRGDSAITVTQVIVTAVSHPVRCPLRGVRLDHHRLAGRPPAVTLGGLDWFVPAHRTVRSAVPIELGRRARGRCARVVIRFRYLGTATSAAMAVRLPLLPRWLR